MDLGILSPDKYILLENLRSSPPAVRHAMCGNKSKKENVFHTYFYFKEFFEKIFFQKENRSDHFLNIVYKERDGKIVDKESDDLVTFTNHSLNTDF